MHRCYEHWLGRSPRAHREAVRVLDVGRTNVDGGYAEIFSDPRFEHIGADSSPGEGVAVVLEDLNNLPLADASVDIVIGGQAIVRAPDFWRMFEEMARVVHPDGLIFLVVPTGGPIDRDSVDRYRLLPEALPALARHAQIRLLASWIDDKGPWNDLVGVFSHRIDAGSQHAMPPMPTSRYALERAVAPLLDETAAIDPRQELVRGDISYLDVLASIHARLEPRLYLEIGVRRGRSLGLARCPAVAVDPQPDIAASLPPEHRLYRETSDDFFETLAAEVFAPRRPDLVFIDGMHLFEFALRDFIHAERYALSTTLMVIDDIFPNHPAQAERRRVTRVWTGDVWKLHDCLREHRPDLVLLPLDTGPTGLLLVAGLDPSSRTLSAGYNPLVSRFAERRLDDDGDARIGREGALSPSDPRLDAFLAALRVARESGTLHNGPAVRDRLMRSL